MSIEKIREAVAGFNTSAGALAVLAAAIDARLGGLPLDSRLAPHANEVLEALGLRAAIESATAPELAAVLPRTNGEEFIPPYEP